MNVNPPNRTYSPSMVNGRATHATNRCAIAHTSLVSASVVSAGIVGSRQKVSITREQRLEHRMQWTHVAIADLEPRPECVHRAYLDPEDTWNGWTCPYFEKSEVERMAAWLPEFDDDLKYDDVTDTFTTTHDADAPESFAGTIVDGMHLYPIVNGSWTRSIVEEPASGCANSDS